jgi:hypothetical protein
MLGRRPYQTPVRQRAGGFFKSPFASADTSLQRAWDLAKTERTCDRPRRWASWQRVRLREAPFSRRTRRPPRPHGALPADVHVARAGCSYRASYRWAMLKSDFSPSSAPSRANRWGPSPFRRADARAPRLSSAPAVDGLRFGQVAPQLVMMLVAMLAWSGATYTTTTLIRALRRPRSARIWPSPPITPLAVPFAVRWLSS